MPKSAREQEPTTPDQLIRMFRLRPRTGRRKKLRQVDLAGLVGIDTRTLQQWESGERLPGADNLQRLMSVLLAENIFLPGEERREAIQLWEAVSQAYDERPGTYRFYPPFDEHWFGSLLHTASQETEQAQTTLQETLQENHERESSSHQGTAGNTSPTNLLTQPTSFIGRHNDITEITQLLNRQELITLTGMGGCGKTRLALRVGEDLRNRYPDGIWLVELATLSDAALVPSLVATTLGVQEQPEQALSETLSIMLQGKRLLLILDNCEHLIGACATLVEHLRSTCPTLHILATSREALNVAGEVIWHVSLLSLPSRSTQASIYEQAMSSEAVQLFVERGRTLQPLFELTKENAPVIASICQRLEGIPLAIELAAARMSLLSLEQIAVRLADRFHLLTTGKRTALPRHQTLRATLDWSYALLSEKEQILLRRLSVFAGGCTLEAIEAICAWEDLRTERNNMTIEPAEVLDLLAQLVNKSLVMVPQLVPEDSLHDPQYRLLDTMRLYGQEKFAQREGQCRREHLLLQERHARYYMSVIEQAESKFRSGEREAQIARVRTQYENLRVALQWSLTPEGDIEVGMRIAGTLYWFWLHEGVWSEGRNWLEKVLRMMSGNEDTIYQARAVHGLGVLVWTQGEIIKAEQLAQEGVAIARCSGNDAILVTTLRLQVQVKLSQRDLVAARDLAEESVQLARKLGETWNLASSLSTLGAVAHMQGNDAHAQQLFEESLKLFEEAGDHWEQTGPLRNLGHLAWQRGDNEQAAQFYKKSITLCRGIRGTWFLARGLEGLAGVECTQGNNAGAATLLGAAEKQRETLGATVMPVFRAEYEQAVSLTKNALSPQLFAETWHKGRTMSAEQVISYALRNE